MNDESAASASTQDSAPTVINSDAERRTAGIAAVISLGTFLGDDPDAPLPETCTAGASVDPAEVPDYADRVALVQAFADRHGVPLRTYPTNVTASVELAALHTGPRVWVRYVYSAFTDAWHEESAR